MSFNKPIPLTLYIHLPWCVRKCPYCDFNSHALRDNLPEELYVNALLQDLESNLPKIWGRRLTSIFIGGGTPSLFSPKALKRLLQEIHARLPYHPDIEITLEANPGTVEQSRFEGFADAGINRLSLGIQSFNDKHLQKLGRIHNGDEAYKATEAAIKAGIINFNCDLMFGLPDQTVAEALEDLQTALSLQPTHLSWYQLTLEPNTVFYNTKPELPDNDALWEMQQPGQTLLEKTGYAQYEVSAYAQTDYQCQHNLNYWQFGDYLGIGAGAHSKLTDMATQQAYRQWNVRQPKDYLNATKPFLADEKVIAVSELPFEFMLNALRLKHGFHVNLFAERTGLELDAIDASLGKAIEDGLLVNIDDVIKPTALGYLHLNSVIDLFLA